VTDYTRPLLLGYARRDLYLSDPHVTAMKPELSGFAKLEGFAMGSIYLEVPDTAPAAFEALVASVNRYEITAVVLPEWRHLALVGDPEQVKQQFEPITASCHTRPPHELAGPVGSRRPQPLTCSGSSAHPPVPSLLVCDRAFLSPVEGSAADLHKPAGAGRESESVLRQPFHHPTSRRNRNGSEAIARRRVRTGRPRSQRRRAVGQCRLRHGRRLRCVVCVELRQRRLT
jgi:hypothetical protein